MLSTQPLHLEPFPTFSLVGSSVIIATKYGQLNYDAEEFTYYQNLFKMIDVQNKGSVRLDSPQFVMLVLRTDATWKNINRTMDIVLENASSTLPNDQILENDTQDMNKRSIKFYPWLMFCKLLAHALDVSRDPSEKMFKNIHNPNQKRSNAILNFKLGLVVRKFTEEGSIYKQYSVKITDWQLYGEDFQNQHVKFKIVSKARMINRTQIQVESSTSTKDQETFVVERRYREFAAFADVLNKNFKGIVTPPLPLKNIKYISYNDDIINQRAIQLQMFLDYLSSHPDLKMSYELTVFLEAPSPNLKNFIDLYANVDSGQLVLNKHESKQHNHIEGMMKLLQDGANAVTSGAQVVVGPNNKAMELFSSWWGAVKKNIAVLTQPSPAYVVSPDDVQRIQDTTKFLEGVGLASKHLDVVQQHRAAYFQELHKVGLSLKSMSEFEQVPDLIKALQRSSSLFAAISQFQQEKLDRSILTIAIPVAFLGRYVENYKAAIVQHSSSVEELNQAYIREENSRKRVESLLNQQRALGLPISPASPAPIIMKEVDDEEDYESIQSSSLEMNEFQQASNEAQLELCRAETNCDEMKIEEQRLLGYLRKESRRLQFVERHQMLALMTQFAKEQATVAAQAKEMWDDVLKSWDV